MEQWDLYDELRQPLGKLHTRGVELAAGEYHTVVEIFTINRDGRLLLTQRDPVKTYPLLWEATGGSVTAGETSITGAMRELQEETGLRASAEELIKISEIRKDTYFLDVYLWKSKQPIDLHQLKLQVGEVCDAKWVTFHELEEMNRLGLIVPKVWKRLEGFRSKLEALMEGSHVL